MIARDTKEVIEEVSLTFLERKVNKKGLSIFSPGTGYGEAAAWGLTLCGSLFFYNRLNEVVYLNFRRVVV